MRRSTFYLVSLSAVFVLLVRLEPASAAITWTGDLTPDDPNDWTSSDTGIVGDTLEGTLTVDGGDSIEINIGYVAYNNVNGHATITGEDSTWTMNSYLCVARKGNGTLDILSGALVEDSEGYIASQSNSTGLVTVNAATWSNTGCLHVGLGSDAHATLNIAGGGIVTNTVGTIGELTGSDGEVTVRDADSTWTNNDSLYVGGSSMAAGGTGSLTVGTEDTDATVNVTNELKIWNSGTVTLSEGQINTGSLSIDAGGTFTHQNGTLTVNAGAFDPGTPDYTIDGSDSDDLPTVKLINTATMDLTGLLRVGMSYNGALMITDGGQVHSTGAVIGYNLDSQGEVTVAGDGSQWIDNGEGSAVGLNGDGTLTITDGGYVQTELCRIGSNSDSHGEVTVDGVTDGGARATWVNTGELRVGDYGDGSLKILNGGTVSAEDGSVIGYGDTGVGEVTVSGVDLTSGEHSTWNSGCLYVGGYGDGKLTITDGGHVHSGSAYIGSEGGSRGEVTVAGDGSQWFDSGEGLTVGLYGDGTLTITDGGYVEGDYGEIGYYSGSQSKVTVAGAGSQWFNRWCLTVGMYGHGSLEIRDGGTVSVENASFIGDDETGSGAAGEVTVSGLDLTSGQHSTWSNTGPLYVGSFSDGTLMITDGGHVENDEGYIGYETGSRGVVTVGGSGSTWTNSSLYVGGSSSEAGGTGTLTVETGGTVDAGATLKLWSTGTLNLNGGTVRAVDFDWAAGTFNFNYGTLNCAEDLTVTPADALSQLLGPARTISFAKHIQVDGTTTLNDVLTLDGGTFSTGLLVNPEMFQFTSGTFNLTGDDLTIGTGGLFGESLLLPYGKSLSVSGNTIIESGAMLEMELGSFSTGTLTNAGDIRGRGTIVGSLDNTSGGVIRAAAADYLEFSGTGHDNSGQISLTGGTIEFTGAVVNQQPGIVDGRGGLVFNEGLTNHGAMSFGGGADVYGNVVNGQIGSPGTDGEIIVSGGASVAFHDDVVHNGVKFKVSANADVVFFGDVTGAGDFSGEGGVWFESSYNPGNSPAAVSFGGNLALGNAATLVIELYGTEPGEFDAVEVADTLSLDGTLDVRLMDEFTPALGNTFDVLDWSTLDGAFDEVLLPGLESYLAWDTDDLYVTGEIAVTYLTFPGDANLDGVVDDKDASILGAHWLQQSGTTWAMGDFNLDGKVNDKDAAILAAHWGYGTGEEATVPEPSTLALMGMGAVGLFTCLRRRRPQAIIS